MAAELIWMKEALDDIDAIAEFIATTRRTTPAESWRRCSISATKQANSR